MIKLYLQLFAAPTDLVNATTQYVNAATGAQAAAFDSVYTFTPTMKTFYDTAMLENARDNLVFTQLGDPENLPAGEGMTVEWRQFNILPDADTLVEGVIPAGKKFGLSYQTVSIIEKGLYVSITKQLDLHATDPIILGATEEIGASLGRTYDKLVRAALLEGTNTLYADALNTASSNAFVSTPSARHELSNAAATYCGFTPDMIAQAVAVLESANVPTYDGMNYVGIVHPKSAYDLRKTEGWQEAQLYAGSKRLFTNELGEMNGVRFIKSTLAPVIRGADLCAAQRTLTVASYNGTGNIITVDEKLTTEDAAALVGREVIIGGEHMTVVTATAGEAGFAVFTVSDADETAWGANEPAHEDIVYPGEGGALGISIFPIFIMGKGAFKVINPEGAGMGTIVKSAEQIGGPLNQFSTVGGKFSGAAKIVYPERIVCVECAGAYSNTEPDNVG